MKTKSSRHPQHRDRVDDRARRSRAAPPRATARCTGSPRSPPSRARRGARTPRRRGRDRATPSSHMPIPRARADDRREQHLAGRSSRTPARSGASAARRRAAGSGGRSPPPASACRAACRPAMTTIRMIEKSSGRSRRRRRRRRRSPPGSGRRRLTSAIHSVGLFAELDVDTRDRAAMSRSSATSRSKALSPLRPGSSVR